MRITCLLAAVAMLGIAPAYAQSADTFPNRPIKLIVPYAPGGSTDMLGRLIAEHLAQEFKQPVVVENKPGAASIVATSGIAKGDADGYNLLLGTNATFSVNKSLYKTLPYDPKDIALVSALAITPQVLVTAPNSPLATVQDIINAAKAGTKLSFGSSGSGSGSHLAGALFNDMAKLDASHVPYKGESQAVTDVAGRQISFSFPNVVSATQYVKGGLVRPLAISSAKRSTMLPDVPTLAELGLKGFDYASYFGFAVQARTPQPIVDKLHAALTKVIEKHEVKEKIIAAGGEPMTGSIAEFSKYVDQQSELSARVIKASGAQID